MPRLDGLGRARRLKADPAAAARADCDGFLRKPLDLGALASAGRRPHRRTPDDRRALTGTNHPRSAERGDQAPPG